jgi:hypothetical protein
MRRTPIRTCAGRIGDVSGPDPFSTATWDFRDGDASSIDIMDCLKLIVQTAAPEIAYF